MDRPPRRFLFWRAFDSWQGLSCYLSTLGHGHGQMPRHASISMHKKVTYAWCAGFFFPWLLSIYSENESLVPVPGRCCSLSEKSIATVSTQIGTLLTAMTMEEEIWYCATYACRITSVSLTLMTSKTTASNIGSGEFSSVVSGSIFHSNTRLWVLL